MKEKELESFVEEVTKLSIKYNVFPQAIIDFDGPKIRYVQLSKEEITKLRNYETNK
jgi:hypothetical protein